MGHLNTTAVDATMTAFHMIIGHLHGHLQHTALDATMNEYLMIDLKYHILVDHLQNSIHEQV